MRCVKHPPGDFPELIPVTAKISPPLSPILGFDDRRVNAHTATRTLFGISVIIAEGSESFLRRIRRLL